MINIKTIASSSAGNCYRVSDNETILLLEAGVNFKLLQKEMMYKVTSVSGCLISHEHQDHAKAVRDLIQVGIDCYMSEGTAKALNVYGNSRVKIVSAGEVFRIGSWKLMAFDLNHDCEEPLGFLLCSNKTGEKLVFITDTYYVKHKFQGLNYIMIECNYATDILTNNVINNIVSESMRSRIVKSHLSLENCKEFLRANDLSDVKEIYLLHLSDNNSDEVRFKKEVCEVSGRLVYVANK